MIPSRTKLVLWVAVFVVLNLYIKLVPSLFQQDNVSHWIVYWLTFFGIAFVVARYVLRLQGLQSFGLRQHTGWFLNLAIGFLIGSSVYAIKYLVCYGFGMFDTAGTMDSSFIAILVAQALLAMFFSSAMNDVLIRGYWLPYLREKHMMKGYLIFATVLYMLDDSWHEGLQVENMVFSAILGITFAYTVLKTGSIWMSIGLHWGGNVLYRMMYGFDGQGIWRLENIKDEPLYEYLSIALTSLMFPVVYMVLKHRFIKTDEEPGLKEVSMTAKVA